MYTSQIDGCTDPTANNYNPNATNDDGSCDYRKFKWLFTDPNYLEYDTDTECETLIVSGCTDSTADNYDPEANTDNGSCYIDGCMDVNADNYDVNATQNDGFVNIMAVQIKKLVIGIMRLIQMMALVLIHQRHTMIVMVIVLLIQMEIIYAMN